MRVASICVVEPEDRVFALVQAGAGVEVERQFPTTVCL